MQNKENKTNEPEAKKTQAKKDTDNNTKKQQTKSQNKQKQPAKKAKQQKEKTTEQNINAKPSLIKRVFSSMAFWTFLLVIGFAMIGFGLFGKTAQPAQAKSSLQQTDEIRYGTSGEVALQLDKKVSFDGGEVVWYVDGIEAKRGSATQSKSFVLKHSFDRVHLQVLFSEHPQQQLSLSLQQALQQAAEQVLQLLPQLFSSLLLCSLLPSSHPSPPLLQLPRLSS